MSKEIIIDEVNVAECIYYNAEKLANCGMFALGDFKCEGQICLYKQLQRLKKENKELKVVLEKSGQVKKLVAFDRNGNAYFVSENNKYKQALEEIRDISNKFCSDCICLGKNCEECVTDSMKRIINEVLDE